MTDFARAPEHPDLIAVRERSGEISYVKEGDLPQAMAAGAVPATKTEADRAKLGAVGTAVLGTTYGIAQGLTLGLAVPAEIRIAEALGAYDTAEAYRQGARLAQEQAPEATFAGEIVGGALPMVFGAPPAGVAARLGAGAAAKTGASIASRVAVRALEGAAAGAAVGAVSGIGAQATEDAIEDKGFAASSYLSSAIRGGAVGALLGGSIGVGAAAAEGVAGRAAGLFERRLGRRAAAAETAAPVAETAAPSLTPRVTIDPDAGLYGTIEDLPRWAPKPIVIRPDKAGVRLSADAIETAATAEAASPISIDPVQRLRATAMADVGATAQPVDASARAFIPGRPRRVRESDLLYGWVDAEAPVFSRLETASRAASIETERAPIAIESRIEGQPKISIPVDAGLYTAETDTARALEILPKQKTAKLNLYAIERDKGTSSAVRAIRIESPSEAAIQAELAKQGKLSVEDWLRAQADRKLLESVGAVGAPDESRLAATLRTQKFDGKPLVEPLASPAEIARRIQGRAAEVEVELSRFPTELDKTDVRPILQRAISQFEFRTSGLGAEAHPARAFLEQFAKENGSLPSFRATKDALVKLDEIIRSRSRNNRPGVRGYTELRDAIALEYDRSVQKAAKLIGDETLSKYKSLKRLSDDLKTLAEYARKRDQRQAVDASTFALATLGGPKAIGAYVAKVAKDKYGAQTAAYLLDKATQIPSVIRSAQWLDDRIRQGVKAFLRGEKTASQSTARKVSAEELQRIHDVVRSPEAVAARAESAIGPLQRSAPKLATQIATRISAVAAYLANALPKPRRTMTGGFGPSSIIPLSDSDMLRARHILETVENPSSVVDRMLDGNLSREHVDTLRVAHPDVYERIRRHLIEHGSELREQLPVQRQVMLSLLFGVAVTEAMLPENVRAFQATFVDGEQAPPGGVERSVSRSIRLETWGQVGLPSDDREKEP
jgi:hypothetical protein